MSIVSVRRLLPMEFHISRRARARYGVNDALFSFNGNVILANFLAARTLAQKINAQRDLIRFPEQAVRAGQINAMGLIDEILHYVVYLYRQQRNPEAIHRAFEWLNHRIGTDRVDAALRAFVIEFPPIAVYRDQISIGAYLRGETDGIAHRDATLEELLLLWLANTNPAFSPFRELFEDVALARDTAYPAIVSGLAVFFETQPRFGPDNQNLVEMLRAPALASPHSLEGQLGFIRERWGYLLGPFLERLLSSLDLIDEEERAFFVGDGPGPSLVYEFTGLESEPERFSPDQDWMPRLVLIAKNTYVWLDQLSRQYRREISRLDQIPDEELDLLARRGFTGLWLIGLWERSKASQRIKQLCGNPDAVASAYSVFDYQIAADLGGEAAYRNLRERAWRRGIRLASDMVANHMGIDSRWVIEHPDWFISLDHSPFPSYTFNGPDLSWDPRVGIFLEDHYYTRTDAAVVFKRLDRWTGREDYIYHGNDGTRMPWNDTAQLNLLRADVREAIIQTILHVARQFPIIRFDAAMTLAKRHFQRLWFPEPGTGSDIPSRAGHGLTRQQIDQLMPVEFWREVVDRVAVEAPDTLLLAEAFWLMEGYFVRTLGMHRVYNSAFMNMLRDEENAKYRAVMKNTLEFDPEIMRRYVNFMNNPDERTAVDQFGKGDKYFGVCTLLATLPGLPMFGHGQIEGFAEKYGMEFRRAYWDEQPDPGLITRHEREIFPLLHRRALFAGVESFRLYDFFTPDGVVNEDVFAYSNRLGDERALVIYHNRYAEARGWIRTSVAYAAKTGHGDERALVQATLAEGLGVTASDGHYWVFRDQASGLEYLRSGRELVDQGLYVELGAYQYHVFLDFREVVDSPLRPYARLAAELNGRGVPSIEEALREMVLEPILTPFRAIVNPGTFGELVVRLASGQPVADDLLDQIDRHTATLLDAVRQYAGADQDPTALAMALRRELRAIVRLAASARPCGRSSGAGQPTSAPAGESDQATAIAWWGTILAWHLTHRLGSLDRADDDRERSRSWIDEWLLGKTIARVLRDLGLDDDAARRAVTAAKALAALDRWWERLASAEPPAYRLARQIFEDPDGRPFLRVNRFQGIVWFNKEAYEALLGWLRTLLTLGLSEEVSLTGPTEQHRSAALEVLAELQRASETSRYQVERLLATLVHGPAGLAASVGGAPLSPRVGGGDGQGRPADSVSPRTGSPSPAPSVERPADPGC